MNKKTVIILLLLTVVTLAGIPASFALSQYNTSLNAVYGNGSCATCHVNASNDGPRTAYGKLFENQTNHSSNASAALIAIGRPPATSSTTPVVTVTSAATATMTATPAATTAKKTPEVTSTTSKETPEATTATPEEKKAAPGFGIAVSLLGLFALFILAKRNNK